MDITVTFTGPRGDSITRPAFWDGGSAWKVRFAPTAVGSWNWQTECSDQTNDGLNARSGRLECLPAEGGESNNVGRVSRPVRDGDGPGDPSYEKANPPPHYRHGFLRVSDNRRHFVHADGTPFFWLGDTHWQVPDTERLDACNHPQHAGQTCPHGGQFQHLVADRRGKGFTVYQTRWSNYNHRTGAWTSIDDDLRADNGQWKIPIRPDGDWVLVVRKQDRTVATQMVVAPSDDYPRNGEATLIVSDKGELLLFYGAHAGSGDWDRAVIRAVRSADRGRIWSERTTQLEDNQRSLFHPSLTRLANGELGLTHTVLAHGQDAHKVFRRSADEGRTWSEPLKISTISPVAGSTLRRLVPLQKLHRSQARASRSGSSSISSRCC